MKKTLFFIAAMFVSGTVLAGTDHYVLLNGTFIQHLKITERNKEYQVKADVDFEPTAEDKGKQHCSASIEGEAKLEKDVLILKKHSEVDATSCELKIQVTDTGAKVEQSKACDHFVTGICRFSTDGKELVKIK